MVVPSYWRCPYIAPKRILAVWDIKEPLEPISARWELASANVWSPGHCSFGHPHCSYSDTISAFSRNGPTAIFSNSQWPSTVILPRNLFQTPQNTYKQYTQVFLTLYQFIYVLKLILKLKMCWIKALNNFNKSSTQFYFFLLNTKMSLNLFKLIK